MMPDTIRSADPTPRTLEQMYRELKGLEDKVNIRLVGYDEAVRLLQAHANRQPTTEAVDGDVKALKELTAEQFAALKELVNAKFEGNKTALDAALKTQKEASDKIEANFTRQFESIANIVEAKTKGLDDKIADNKDRITRTDGRGTGRNDFIGWIVAAVVIIGGIIGMVAKFSN